MPPGASGWRKPSHARRQSVPDGGTQKGRGVPRRGCPGTLWGTGIGGGAKLLPLFAELLIEGPKGPGGVGGSKDGFETGTGPQLPEGGEEMVQLCVGEAAEDQHGLGKGGGSLCRGSLPGQEDGEGTVQLTVRHPPEPELLDGTGLPKFGSPGGESGVIEKNGGQGHGDPS